MQNSIPAAKTRSSELVDSTNLLACPELLRKRYLADGYVFLRGLLSREDLTSVMHDMLNFAHQARWTAAGASTDSRSAAVEMACVEPEPAFRLVWNRAFRLRQLHALAHTPSLQQVVGGLLGGRAVFTHPKKIPRYVFPVVPKRNEFTTPAHQDYPAVQGSENGLTAWFPLHDCCKDEGALMVARASHLDGLRRYELACGAGGTSIVGQEALDWRSADFSCGDVVLFSTLAVHKASPNLSPNLRLSVDCRFQPLDEPVCDATIGLEDWDHVYSEWLCDDELRFYWRHLNLKIVPVDHAHYRNRDQLALAEAAKGNRAAISSLQRIVEYGQDQTNVSLAKELLRNLQSAGATL